MLVLTFSNAYAYLDKYPPYKFKDGPPKHLEANTIVDYENPEYKSKDGKVYVHLSETSDKLNFIIRNFENESHPTRSKT